MAAEAAGWAEVLAAVLAGRTLPQALAAAAPANGRGVIMDTAYGVLRFRGELEGVLTQLLRQPLKERRLHALLLGALYRLAHTDAPAYAVVNEAVEAAGPTWARGLANGVLRNFLRNPGPLLERARAGGEGCWNFPAWWVDKLRAAYPEDWQGMLAVSLEHPPLTLRVNRRRISPDGYLALLAQAGLAAGPSGPWALTLDQPVPVTRLPGFADGLVSVQDAGAQWAALALDLADGQRVLDACAAPGGKTGHILECAAVDLLALDADAARLERVRENLARLHLDAHLLAADAADPAAWWDRRPFDRILADVPCSASGVVRRHPDIKWQRRPADLVTFTRQQAKILAALWQTLAPGGKLLYATCSVFPEENQNQIQAFRKTYADARRLPLPAELGGGRLLPARRNDGFFYALLEKSS